jgi:CBS domain-containing protein
MSVARAAHPMPWVGAHANPRAATMRVSDVMTTHVYTCTVRDTLDRAAEIMAEHECGAVPILDETGHAVAIVTDRDICLAAHACGKPLTQLPVLTGASRRIYVARTFDTLDFAHELMCRHHVRRLPVIDAGGNLIGILSIADLVRAVRACGEPGIGDA